MDINSIRVLDEDTGRVLQFKDPTGKLETYRDGTETKPVAVRVMGSYSRAYRDAAKVARDRFQDAVRQGDTVSDAEQETIQFDTEAACIQWWCFQSNGQSLPITGANWKAIAEKRPDWREQFLTALTDHEAFFVESSPH